jgi:YesN/AraC family two-component response regulator
MDDYVAKPVKQADITAALERARAALAAGASTKPPG